MGEGKVVVCMFVFSARSERLDVLNRGRKIKRNIQEMSRVYSRQFHDLHALPCGQRDVHSAVIEVIGTVIRSKKLVAQ
ncbi:hypothetical protein WT55_07405 [Burkholderia pseudomultivorans]|nr:hypothetical protein WT55_07405 [Burkholderia pseudomultivorans]